MTKLYYRCVISEEAYSGRTDAEYPEPQGQHGVVADQRGELEDPGLAQPGHCHGGLLVVQVARPDQRPRRPDSGPLGRVGQVRLPASPDRGQFRLAQTGQPPGVLVRTLLERARPVRGDDQDGQLTAAPGRVPWNRTAVPSAWSAPPSPG